MVSIDNINMDLFKQDATKLRVRNVQQSLSKSHVIIRNSLALISDLADVLG